MKKSWEKHKPSVSNSMAKVLYDPRSYLGNQLSIKIDRGHKRGESVFKSNNTIKDSYVRGYKDGRQKRYEKNDILIGTNNLDQVPVDDITQKILMADDWIRLSRNDFWAKYGF